MYETFYGFREKPFSLVPDPDFLYLGRHHRAALNILEYGLRGEASFALISGEVGSGKTILIRRFLRMVDPRTTVGLITNTHASLGNLLDWILLAFNLDYRGKEKVELFEILTNFLRDQRAHGRRTVLIIDEAQNMELEMLEELRMLSNINVDKELMFQIVLAGQPEILDKINRPELRQLAQRISANFHLSPLTLDETRDYICHRLVVAGAGRAIFDNLSCAAVYYFTQGLPRPINILCDAALVYGYGEERDSIGLDTILDVVENVERSGLKALQALEGGFDRDRFTAEITALAETYVDLEPPEEDFGAQDTEEVRPEEEALAAGEGTGPQGASNPATVGASGPRVVGPATGAVRDVPAGIPPLLSQAAQDAQEQWPPEPEVQKTAKKKKLRRLFDAAAAAVVALFAAVVLLQGFDLWSENQVSEETEAAVATEAPEQPGDEPNPAVTIQLEAPSDVDQRVASLLELAKEQAANDGRSGGGSDDAYQTYHEILALKPGYQPALDGLRELDAQRLEHARLTQPNTREEPGEPAVIVVQQEDAASVSQPEESGQEPAPAKPVQTAAIPASPNAAPYTHWVRLGAFRRPESAPIMWSRLQRSQSDLLGSLSPQITKANEGGDSPLYRLRVGPLPNAAASQALCRSLIGRGVDCVALRVASEIAGRPQPSQAETTGTEVAKLVPAPEPVDDGNADLYKLALAHSQDGEAYSKDGEYEKALQEFNTAIRLNPGLASAHYLRGEIYFQRGDYQQAIRDFTRTINLAPDYTFAYYSRGLANEKMGETEEAILDFTHTVRLKPSYAPAYNDRAKALYSLGHLREALRDSELAISVAPDTPAYLATHSLILAALGRSEGAFATLEQAMAVANVDWIKRYQQAMSRDGYYRGPIDGRYGPATKSAMRACLVSGCSMADWN
jgi:type II secretory pathway predicted ATPase ExeA/tetratricopeptide (TPR) repeat protein